MKSVEFAQGYNRFFSARFFDRGKRVLKRSSSIIFSEGSQPDISEYDLFGIGNLPFPFWKHRALKNNHRTPVRTQQSLRKLPREYFGSRISLRRAQTYQTLTMTDSLPSRDKLVTIVSTPYYCVDLQTSDTYILLMWHYEQWCCHSKHKRLLNPHNR